jgi:alanine racemase
MTAEAGPWVDVDLGALQRNARRYASLVGVPLLPMVKANAYGLGAVPVARALEALGPWGFGVASLDEAAALREAGLTRPLVTVVPFVASDLDRALELDVRPAIADVDALARWIDRSERPFHLVVDTGMARGGLRWDDADGLARARQLLRRARGFEGVFTHFYSADRSPEATDTQWSAFQRAIACLGTVPRFVHAANSAAAQWGARYAGSLARPGIYLYGGRAGALEPEAVARLSARVVAVQRIAPGDTVSYGATYRATATADVVVLGIGYADGLPRSAGGRAGVWIAGGVYPIAGRVNMDMTMVVTPPGTARVGDVGVLWGPDLSIDAQAEAAGTIAYELLTSLGPRVTRRYGDST